MSDVIEKTRALLGASELTDIGYFEMSAERGAVAQSSGSPVVGPGRIDDAEVEGVEHELGVYWTDEGDRILVRFRAILTSNAGEVRVGAQAEYALEGMTRADLDVEVEEEFVNRVAVMALVPYVRSGISDLSGRVFGTTLTMAIVRPGEIEFARKSSN